jgi:hypothetical protein
VSGSLEVTSMVALTRAEGSGSKSFNPVKAASMLEAFL